MKALLRSLALCCLLAFGIALVAPARASADPANFIQGLGNQTISILQNQSLGQPQRKQEFEKLFRKGFDVHAISTFVLGRYRRTATPEQLQEFEKVFENYIVSIYSVQFSNYSGQGFKVTGQQQVDPETSTVTSEISRPNGGPPIHLTWIITAQNGSYKIVDVNVENLSMRTTQRDQFASILSQNGGSVAALTDQLKAKVAETN